LTFATTGRRATGIVTTAATTTTTAATTATAAAFAALPTLATFAFLTAALTFSLCRRGTFRTRSLLTRLRSCLWRLLLSSGLLRAGFGTATVGSVLFTRLTVMLLLLRMRVATRFLCRLLAPLFAAAAAITLAVPIPRLAA
jgi:hypothetical protein